MDDRVARCTRPACRQARCRWTTFRLGAAGMWFSGISPDGRLVEYIELRDHPWFVATQAHPELKSRPNQPHPLFRDFVGAAAVRSGLPAAAHDDAAALPV